MLSEEERDDIKRELDTLSCPFTWKLADASTHYMKNTLYNKVVDDNIDEEAYLYLEKLISSLVILYEKVLFSEIDRAHIKLNECDQILLELQDKHEDEDITRVIEHIFYSTKCHYLFEMNNIEELKILLPKIIETSNFTNIELAALAGCQSVAWSMFMDFGRKKAIDLANQAIQQNSDKALWHFTLAKNLRRDRRFVTVFSKPTALEKKHFELAYQKSSNPVFGIYLAQMYRDSISYVPVSEKRHLERLLLDLYKEILKLSDNNYKILLKLAIGFIRLRTNAQPKLAKDCLDAVEKLQPNNSTYFHYKGKYFETFGNVKEALEFYKKGAELYNYAAEMDYVKLGWKVKHLDPLTYLQSMLIKYNKTNNQKSQDIYLCIATCYYQKRDLKHAMEYYLKAIEEDPDSKKLKVQYTFLDFTTKRYRNGIYEFLALEFLKIVRNCREYRCKDETFIVPYNKLQKLCQLYDKGFETSQVLTFERYYNTKTR